jgi:hypothetical protein
MLLTSSTQTMIQDNGQAGLVKETSVEKGRARSVTDLTETGSHSSDTTATNAE